MINNNGNYFNSGDRLIESETREIQKKTDTKPRSVYCSNVYTALSRAKCVLL